MNGDGDYGSGEYETVETYKKGRRLQLIEDAIERLDENDTSLWTQTGKPKISALGLSWDVFEDERDKAWILFLKHKKDGGVFIGR